LPVFSRWVSSPEPVDTAAYQWVPPPRPAKKILRDLCMLFFNSALRRKPRARGPSVGHFYFIIRRVFSQHFFPGGATHFFPTGSHGGILENSGKRRSSTIVFPAGNFRAKGKFVNFISAPPLKFFFFGPIE
jgi:hypothetical protein